ncbi:hypothetical protein [Agrobacterium tumefaciens]|uniref:hypothetical protein n=1 Tax=Agrobacterium tumefaciens TaxID=358 RepID=UPI001F2F53B2|nr:hypothetical protein [Agrobacterium tumefaciens]WCJ63013.1 hypothetical protein G6M15_02060 [Agrobacterium tumefaciens]
MTVRIAICGSMAFVDEMEAIASAFEALGYQPMTPAREERNFDWTDLKSAEVIAQKKYYIDRHLEIIRHCDVVLIANFPKRGIEGYVGPNTLMEAAFAYALNVPVIFLNGPSAQESGLECMAVAFGRLSGDATGISELLPTALATKTEGGTL